MPRASEHHGDAGVVGSLDHVVVSHRAAWLDNGGRSRRDLSPYRLREIENFFQTYKTLENRPTEVNGWLGVEDAWRIIDDALDPTRTTKSNPGTWR